MAEPIKLPAYYNGKPAGDVTIGSMEPSRCGMPAMTGETLVAFVQASTGGDLYISEKDLPLNASA